MRNKILVIHHCGYIGGAGISLLHILKSLKQSSLDVIVYCPKSPDDMLKEIKKLGFECISNPKKVPIIEHFSGSDRFILDYRSIRNLIMIAKEKDKIKRMIETVSPDIVVVNSMTLSYVGKIARSMNIKAVCFHRETYTKGLLGIRTKYIKYILSNYFDKVVFISDFDLKQSGRMKSDSYVIHDKVILSDFSERCEMKSEDDAIRTPEATKILYTGGMSQLKGAHILIKALAKCKSNAQLIFLQYDGVRRKKNISDYSSIKNKLRYLLGKDYSAKVLSLIDRYDLWNRIHFYPVTNDVAKYFKSSDIIIFPSTSPHQARPIYEAGAAGKPIIITASPNISEFVDDGQNGFVFKNGDSDKLAELIDKLAFNKDLCKSMGDRNYLKAIKNHDFVTLKEELINVFNWQN